MAQEDAFSRDLTARVERLESLLAISRLMNATSNQERLINGIAREISTYLEADRCSIFFHNRLTDELYTHVGSPAGTARAGSDKDTRIRMPSDRGITGQVFSSGDVRNVMDASKDPLFSNANGYENAYHFGISAPQQAQRANRRDRTPEQESRPRGILQKTMRGFCTRWPSRLAGWSI